MLCSRRRASGQRDAHPKREFARPCSRAPRPSAQCFRDCRTVLRRPQTGPEKSPVLLPCSCAPAPETRPSILLCFVPECIGASGAAVAGPARLAVDVTGQEGYAFRRQRKLKTEISAKERGMELRRPRWILGVALASFAVARMLAADEPKVTEEQKIDFLQHAKVIASQPEKKGKSNASHLTLSDGKVTYDASFEPIDEKKAQGPGPGGGIEVNFRDYWGYDIAGYRIAQLLGMDDMVPAYTERKLNGTTGAISWRVSDVQFDEADRHSRKIDVPGSVLDGWNKQMYKLRVLTQLFYDVDDNLTNVLIKKDWKIWRIDFTRAFRLQHNLKNPKDLVQCDREVLAKLRQLSYDQVLDATKPYLTKNEVKALIARRDQMVAHFDELVAQKGESEVLY